MGAKASSSVFSRSPGRSLAQFSLFIIPGGPLNTSHAFVAANQHTSQRGSDYFKRKGAYITVGLGGTASPVTWANLKAHTVLPHLPGHLANTVPTKDENKSQSSLQPALLAHSTDSDCSGHHGEDTVHFPWAENWPTSGPVTGRRRHLASQHKQMNGVLFLMFGSCLCSRRLGTCARATPSVACMRPHQEHLPGCFQKAQVLGSHLQPGVIPSGGTQEPESLTSPSSDSLAK